MKDIYDYRRHIENNCHPAFRKALAKEFMEKDKEIERLKNKVKEINENMNYQINLKTKNANEINRLTNIINELGKYLEEEKDRLARETSNIYYEDSLGEKRLVNEDMFNEIIFIQDKLQELKGDSSNGKTFENNS